MNFSILPLSYMTKEEIRKLFESIINNPPYTHNIERWAEDKTWPNQYIDYRVQFAWDILNDFLRKQNGN